MPDFKSEYPSLREIWDSSVDVTHKVPEYTSQKELLEGLIQEYAAIGDIGAVEAMRQRLLKLEGVGNGGF